MPIVVPPLPLALLVSSIGTVMYRVGQINPYKFQMVGNTHTKRNGNICFIQVIVKICIYQDIEMFY